MPPADPIEHTKKLLSCSPLTLNCRANFLGTEQLLQLASRMPHLRSFVYVSTYYVNNFKPYNTAVPEEVHYPTLQLAGGVCVLGGGG